MTVGELREMLSLYDNYVPVKIRVEDIIDNSGYMINGVADIERIEDYYDGKSIVICGIE